MKLLWSSLFPSSVFLVLLWANQKRFSYFDPASSHKEFQAPASRSRGSNKAFLWSLPSRALNSTISDKGGFWHSLSHRLSSQHNTYFSLQQTTLQEMKLKQSKEQLLCLSTGSLSLQWRLIWSKVPLKKGNGQVLLLPNLRPYVVLITCGKVCLSHSEETCWSAATEEKGRCFNKLETPLS